MPSFRLLPLVFLLLGGMQTSCEKEATPNDFQSGMEKFRAGDFDQAIMAWSRHLRKNPSDADAYAHRGMAKNAKGDLDGALADFDCALTLKPGFVRAHVNRGIARKKHGDPDGALEDFNDAIELDPKNANAYYYRATIRTDIGDLAGAVADYTRALEFDPKDALNHFNRGIAEYLRGDWEKARRDFDAAATEQDPQPYGWLYSHVLQVRLGQGAQARVALRASMKHPGDSSPGDWFSSLAGFLLGDIDEAALLAAAAKGGTSQARDQLCEAWYFAGMARLFAGQHAGAADCFRQSIGTRREKLAEHSFARAELETLVGKTEPAPERTRNAPAETLRGRVHAASRTSIALREKETGKIRTFAVSRGTRVTLDGVRASIQRVKPAMDANVTLDAEGAAQSIDATVRK